MQHVIDPGWMRWAGVPHVINAIGPMRGIETNSPFHECRDARLEGVRYFSWTASNASCRRSYRRLITTMVYLLGQKDVCLLVHCIHSRDRSVFLVAVLCVTILGVTIDGTLL